jgi:hypothetical protein
MTGERRPGRPRPPVTIIKAVRQALPCLHAAWPWTETDDPGDTFTIFQAISYHFSAI